MYISVFMNFVTPYSLCDKLMDQWNLCMYVLHMCEEFVIQKKDRAQKSESEKAQSLLTVHKMIRAGDHYLLNTMSNRNHQPRHSFPSPWVIWSEPHIYNLAAHSAFIASEGDTVPNRCRQPPSWNVRSKLTRRRHWRQVHYSGEETERRMRHSSRVLTKYFSNAIEQAILTVIVQELLSVLLPCLHP